LKICLPESTGITYNIGGTAAEIGGSNANWAWQGRAEGGFLTTGGERTSLIRITAQPQPVRVVVVYTNNTNSVQAEARRPQVNSISGGNAPGPGNAAPADRESFRWDFIGAGPININIGSTVNSIRINEVRVYSF